MLQRAAPVGLPSPPPDAFRWYRQLSLRDVFLGFAGYRDLTHTVHRAIAELGPGDRLQVKTDGDHRELLDGRGTAVGQLARGFNATPGAGRVHASVQAVASWDRESSEPECRQGLRSNAWEVVVPELVFEPER